MTEDRLSPAPMTQGKLVAHAVLRVTLASGHEVNVEALHIESTYAGFDGVPHDTINSELLASKVQRTLNVWGQRPVHLIRPEVARHPVHSAFSTHGEFLPDTTYHVWLSEAGSACRELVVVWFGESQPEVGIRDLIVKASRDVDWSKHSQEYEP